MIRPATDSPAQILDGWFPSEIATPGIRPAGAEGTQAEALVTRLIEEMAAGWRQGQCPSAEEFLIRHPELGAEPQVAVQLIYEEMCLRQEAGQEAARTEVLGRFPQWQAELKDLFACYDFLVASTAPPHFPNPGEVLGDFLLVAELDRGARGRVFLAYQSSLSNRPLVLKFTPRDGEEHLALARFQHTHIVPLYSLQDFPAQNLQALCMPYLGGTTLARLLKSLQAQPLEHRTGAHLLQALAEGQARVPVTLPAQGPAWMFLARASYVQAVCWIGACLGDAVQYAHERGLVHLDLKPSNVLLAADGQPMLLDFHLAREPIQPDGPAPEWLGGTPEYMSPEQRVALAAVQRGQPVPAVVDGRSDIYSLGVLLYEALAGSPPVQGGTGPRRLNRCNPNISRGLADIIHKCLAHDPGARYPNAATLAADLKRHLNDLPLRGVANRSLTERWRKWRRRHPHRLALAGMLLATFVMILSAALAVRTNARTHHRQQLQEAQTAARTALQDGQNLLKQHRYAEAMRTLQRGLSHAEAFHESAKLTQALGAQLLLARRAEEGHHLHALADCLRFLYCVASLPADQLQALEERCRAFWSARGRILWQHRAELDREAEQRLRTDLLDLAVLWVDLRLRLASANRAPAVRQEALQVLAEAEALFGPSHLLYRQRQSYAEALGLTEMAKEASRRASESIPRTAWEHYVLGRFLLGSGDLEVAAGEFQRALDLQPQDFWPNFYRGICAYRLKQYDQAATAFHVCVGLAPQCAECFYHRALAHAALGQNDRALRDYSRALEIKPTLTAAARNRDILLARK